MYLKNGARRVYAEESGEGEPLILIHGGNLDCRMWDDQFPVFAKAHRTIRYDVCGHGRSDPPRETYSDLDDLYGLLASLDVEEAILVGLSLGGRIALDFALEYPDAVKGLVLAGPGLSGYAFTDAEVGGNLGRVSAAVREGDLALARELLLENPYWRQDDPAIRSKVKSLLDGYSFGGWLNPALYRDTSVPAIKRLHDVGAPTLIVVGDRDVSDILRISELLEKGIPGAVKVTVPGAGHLLNIQRPDQFNRIVLDFLASL